MTSETTFYRSDSCYCTGNNYKFEHVLKENGSIDFDRPPAGYRYTATPIEKDMIKSWGLDPKFVTMHKFGSKVMLCYMELTDAVLGNSIEQPYKTEATKDKRHRRCRIISEKTGREIMCPYDGQHSCATCEKAGDDNRKSSKPLSLDALFTSVDDEDSVFDIPAPNNTELEFEEKDTREHIRAELKKLDAIARSKNRRAMNLEVYDLWIQEYSSAEIAKELGIAKATLHDDLVRIAKVVKKYID